MSRAGRASPAPGAVLSLEPSAPSILPLLWPPSPVSPHSWTSHPWPRGHELHEDRALARVGAQEVTDGRYGGRGQRETLSQEGSCGNFWSHGMFHLDLADLCTEGARTSVSAASTCCGCPARVFCHLWAPRAAFTSQDHSPGQASAPALFSHWLWSQVQALATGSGLLLPKPRGHGRRWPWCWEQAQRWPWSQG